MKLAVTIDVEEEGLFNGRYNPHDVPAENVSRLAVLDPLFQDLGIRPTFLVSYQVARNPAHHELLMHLREKWKGEIGAHLHTWNTPPFEPSPYERPVPSELMPQGLLEAKLSNLFEALEKMGVEPVCFRMGRFNMGPKMFSVLEKTQIRIDSSISPMRRYYGGPAHLSAPVDPYFPDPDNPILPGISRILEVPMTILPLIRKLGHLLEHLGNNHILPYPWISWFGKYLGSLPVQPMWTGLRRLMAAVRLHQIRGGHVVTIFFHSSELMPGGCPEHPSEAHVARFVNKLAIFFSWFFRKIDAECLTLSELYDLYPTAASRIDSVSG